MQLQVLPELRLGVDLRPGDILVMPAHRMLHGTTHIQLQEDGAHRTSCVLYLSGKMVAAMARASPVDPEGGEGALAV